MLRNEKRKYLILLLPFALLILLFELMPLANIFINSFRNPATGSVTFANFTTLFTSEYYLMSIKNSLFVSLLSAFIGIALALLGAYAIHTAGDRMKKFYITTLNMTSNFQGIVLAFAFILLLGNSGILTTLGEKWNLAVLNNYDLYTTSGILITFIYFQIPLGDLVAVSFV
ncbi:MAG TPA: hypothetical protein PL008_00500 [Trichococcus flocculiformis]|nr:hypothetical protein [Trichococcus flocculiformis]